MEAGGDTSGNCLDVNLPFKRGFNNVFYGVFDLINFCYNRTFGKKIFIFPGVPFCPDNFFIARFDFTKKVVW